MPKHKRAATPPLEGEDCGGLAISFDRLRTRIRSYMDTGQYETALFWLDKLLTLCSDAAVDLVAYVQCLLSLGEFERALSALKKRNLELAHPVYQLLAVRCMYGTKRLDEAICLCESPCSEDQLTTLTLDNREYLDRLHRDWCVDANLKLWLGRLQEHLDNRVQAVSAYKIALELDVHCREAFEALIKQRLLTRQEELDLLEMMSIPEQCASPDEAELVRLLYQCDLSKVANAAKVELPPKFAEALEGNLGVMTARAEQLYYAGDHRAAYELTRKIQGAEELHLPSLPLHICILVELFKKCELFALAHKLVDMYPDRFVSWFGVGCYYFVIGSFEGAKRFFCKSTNLDPNCGPAWLAYGHSFAAQQEHDQAMNCYLKAAKLMRGCPLPQLYIGLEYSLTSNMKLGEKFLMDAQNIAPNDPYVLNELAAIEFTCKNFGAADEHFKRVLAIITGADDADVGESSVQRSLSEQWEPLLNNLGHAARKLGDYDMALKYHRRALLLCPKSPSTLGVIGFVYLLKGDADRAIEYFHQSLSLKRDSKMIPSLLTKAMDLSAGFLERDLGFAEIPPLVPSKPVKKPQLKQMTSTPSLAIASRDVEKVVQVQDLSLQSEADMLLENSNDSMDMT